MKHSAAGRGSIGSELSVRSTASAQAMAEVLAGGRVSSHFPIFSLSFSTVSQRFRMLSDVSKCFKSRWKAELYQEKGPKGVSMASIHSIDLRALGSEPE